MNDLPLNLMNNPSNAHVTIEEAANDYRECRVITVRTFLDKILSPDELGDLAYSDFLAGAAEQARRALMTDEGKAAGK